jgi:hypothetical protein
MLVTVDTESEGMQSHSASPQDSHATVTILQGILTQLGVLNSTLKQLTQCVCRERLGSFTEDHSPPTKENKMSQKLGSFGLKRAMKAGPVPGDKDTVTIGGFLNVDGSPYTGTQPTIVPTSPDLTTLTLDTPVGLTYGEHFLKAGTVIVTIVATSTDGLGTVVTQTDTVTITGVLGSFTVTHSLPVVGP